MGNDPQSSEKYNLKVMIGALKLTSRTDVLRLEIMLSLLIIQLISKMKLTAILLY